MDLGTGSKGCWRKQSWIRIVGTKSSIARCDGRLWPCMWAYGRTL